MKYAVFTLLILTGPGFAAEPVYTWHTKSDDPDRVYLYRDGKQIGGWCYQARHYRPLDGDTWGPPTRQAPVSPPVRVKQIQLNIVPVHYRGLLPRGRIMESAMESAGKQLATMAGEAMAELMVGAVKDLTLEMLGQLPGVRKK